MSMPSTFPSPLTMLNPYLHNFPAHSIQWGRENCKTFCTDHIPVPRTLDTIVVSMDSSFHDYPFFLFSRFHIICAHLLCEADINSFDAKINTENLTKCLQTLKQFYGDLYKDKVQCDQAWFCYAVTIRNLLYLCLIITCFTLRPLKLGPPWQSWPMGLQENNNTFRELRNSKHAECNHRIIDALGNLLSTKEA